MYMLNIIKSNIEALQEKYDNAIPVMGSAYWAAQEVHNDKPNFDKFVELMVNMVSDHKFFKWHEPLPRAMRTFCKLAMVDPALVEAYIGMRFEQLVQ